MTSPTPEPQPWITPADLAPFATIEPAKAQAMIEDATAMARMVAPCLADPANAASPEAVGVVRAILRGALLRWDESGAGGLSTRTASAVGFSLTEGMDTRQQRRGLLWPSEIEQLQQVCATLAGGKTGGAYTIDMIGARNRLDPLAGATVNAHAGREPLGEWSPDAINPVPSRWLEDEGAP